MGSGAWVSLVTLTELRRAVDQLYGVYESRCQAFDTATAEVASLDYRAVLLAHTEAALTTLLADVSAESLGAIEQTITYGLRTVFTDRDLSFKLLVTQTRGAQAVEPVLVSGKVQAPILEAFGGGPGQLVAFLLRLIVCHRTGLYPLLLMDETLNMVSQEYAANLSQLLRELSEKLGFTMVMVAHTSRTELASGASRAYEIVDAADGSATFRGV